MKFALAALLLAGCTSASGNKPSFVAQWAQPNAIYANVLTAAK